MSEQMSGVTKEETPAKTEEEIRISTKMADFLRSLDETPGGKYMKILRSDFDAAVSARTRSKDDDRVMFLRELLKNTPINEMGDFVIDAFRFAEPDSPFPESAISSPSYWSGAAAPGAVSAFRAGPYKSKLVMGSVRSGTIHPMLVLREMKPEEIERFTASMQKVELKRKALQALEKHKKAVAAAQAATGTGPATTT